MTKDDDVEAQKASVVPRNQIADFTNVEKDPLVWEIAGITSHYDPEIRKSAAEILGNTIFSFEVRFQHWNYFSLQLKYSIVAFTTSTTQIAS